MFQTAIEVPLICPYGLMFWLGRLITTQFHPLCALLDGKCLPVADSNVCMERRMQLCC